MFLLFKSILLKSIITIDNCHQQQYLEVIQVLKKLYFQFLIQRLILCIIVPLQSCYYYLDLINQRYLNIHYNFRNYLVRMTLNYYSDPILHLIFSLKNWFTSYYSDWNFINYFSYIKMDQRFNCLDRYPNLNFSFSNIFILLQRFITFYFKFIRHKINPYKKYNI